MRLIQFRQGKSRHVGLVDATGDRATCLATVSSVQALAEAALKRAVPLHKMAQELATGEMVDYAVLLAEGQVLAPLDHADPARFLITGTGLSHTGSAAARDKMAKLNKGGAVQESDSMRMFRSGVEGGKPAPGKVGAMPEWFYKGSGECLVAPGAALTMPGYAFAGGEEPEVVGLYIVDASGAPRRIGFALGNEFSDHTVEGQNYLYVASSKLRECSFGPELLLGDLPNDIRGKSRVLRGGKVLWQDDALLGEANMSHSVVNLEHHHFKHAIFRRPGDLHAHYFGAAVLSSAAGIKTQAGDVFEIEAADFGKPLRNTLAMARDEGLVRVQPV